jgi:hypothetical protein
MSSHYRDSKFKVYLSYSEETRGGEICAGQEDHSWPDHEDTVISFTPESLCTRKGDSQETIGVDFDPTAFVGEKIYMVLVRYFDGDTFGRVTGCWYVEGIYTDLKKAKRIVSRIETGKYKDKNTYLPWQTYFR